MYILHIINVDSMCVHTKICVCIYIYMFTYSVTFEGHTQREREGERKSKKKRQSHTARTHDLISKQVRSRRRSCHPAQPAKDTPIYSVSGRFLSSVFMRVIVKSFEYNMEPYVPS